MRRFPFILVLYAFLLIGCGGSSRDNVVGNVTPENGSKSLAPIISEVEDYLPPIDNGRVRIAPPKGWYTPSRNPKYLVRFTRKKGDSYPAIFVTVQPFEEIGEVTSQNVEKYATLLDSPGDNLQSRQIDRFVALSYTKQRNLKEGVRTTPIDLMFLDTVVDHRRYQFKLRVKKGTLDRFLPDLLAVAVKTQFMNRQKVEEPVESTPAKVEATPINEEETKKEKSQATGLNITTKN